MKRLAVIGAGLAIVALLVIFLLARREHPRFGNIERAKMFESHPPARFEKIMSEVKNVLRISSVDTRKRNYLNIGDARMEWSLMSTHERTGWLYFSRPESNEAVWEFAPCSRSSLDELVLGDVDVEFIRNGDTNRIRSAFDAAGFWHKTVGRPLTGRALPVREGQIVLARLTNSLHTIYAIRLINQRGTEEWGSIEIEYVEIDVPKGAPVGPANGSQAIRSETNSTSSAAGSRR